VKTFDILQHPSGKVRAVKQGVSWPGFFFSSIWCLFKDLPVLGIVLFLTQCVLAVIPRIGLPLSLLVNVTLAIRGNAMRKNKLIRLGYVPVSTVSAQGPAAAIAQSGSGVTAPAAIPAAPEAPVVSQAPSASPEVMPAVPFPDEPAPTVIASIDQFIPSGTVVMAYHGALVCTEGAGLAGKRFTIPEDGMYIGRDAAYADVVLNIDGISRRHAWVGPKNGQMFVIDEKSTNGTMVNSRDTERVHEAPLNPGDVLYLGKAAAFRYER